MNWCVYSALRDCQNLHRDRLSDWLAIGYTATTTTTTTTTTTPTPTPNGITVSFPDRFRTAQFSFLLKYENECVHGRILLLVLLLLSVLPLAPLPLQRRYHYYTEEFLPLLFSTWQEFQGSVRNQSETSQKSVKNGPNATSLSLSPLPIPSPSYQNSYAYPYSNFHYHYC